MTTTSSLDAKKRIDDAVDILRSLNVPRAQLNQRSALTLLALLDMRPDTPWGDAAAPLRGITEMMDYFREHFGVTYAPNTRETVRRQTVHQFLQVGLIVANPDEPTRPVNSPHTRYQIEPSVLKLIKTYGTCEWPGNLRAYLGSAQEVRVLREKERAGVLIPVKLPNGGEVRISPGGQNLLIKQIIEEFCPRFVSGGVVVYG